MERRLPLAAVGALSVGRMAVFDLQVDLRDLGRLGSGSSGGWEVFCLFVCLNSCLDFLQRAWY